MRKEAASRRKVSEGKSLIVLDSFCLYAVTTGNQQAMFHTTGRIGLSRINKINVKSTTENKSFVI